MKTYRSEWTDKAIEDDADQLRIEALEPIWDLSQGWHPDIDGDPSFYDAALRRPLQAKKVPNIPSLISLCPEGAVTGHVRVKDGGTISLTQPDRAAPILPLFVRDLAGRVIYIGTTKHRQNSALVSNPHLMPQGSAVFEEGSRGYDLLERVFACPFRFLEMSDKPRGSVSGQEDMAAVVSYFAPNLYPYKLRMDTFYQDGWRLPQTERLFVQPVNERITAERASAALKKLWREKPDDMDYETFLEKNEESILSSFANGCTLIPTLEAFNGINKVDDNFEQTGFWPGRAVTGLHEIVAQEESDAPHGTILKVLELGYVTAQEVQPARVIVSDGRNYQAGETDRYTKSRPRKMYPDLRLPHQRLSAKWGACWIPRHPADFEDPIIWDWEEASSGRFVQTKGPVWDPLHYYYGCVPKVIEAFQKNRVRKNINLVKVPDEMLRRFYPVIDCVGFDSFDLPKKRHLQHMASLLPTSIYHENDTDALCPVGYHPLPISYEYELDNWWFPDLAPKYRISDEVPLNVESHLVKVVRPDISSDKFIASVKRDGQEAPWMTDPLIMSTPRQEPLENYPYLMRYLQPNNVQHDDVVSMVLPYLEATPEGLPLHAFTNDKIRSIESNWPGLYQVYLSYAQKAAQIVALRHKIFQEQFGEYLYGLWEMVPIDDYFESTEKTTDPKKNLPTAAVSGSAEF